MAGDLIFNLNLSRKHKSLALVQGFTQPSVLTGPELDFTRGDVPQVQLRFLVETDDPQKPFEYVDPLGWPGIRFALGRHDQKPTAGRWKFTGPAADQTDWLAYNISAADLQTALQALFDLAGCTVTGDDGGPFTITAHVNAGPLVNDVSVDFSELGPPGSSAYIENPQDGNASSLGEQWIVGLVQAYPIQRETGWVPLTVIPLAVETQQNGSNSAPKANKIFRVTHNPEAYDGSVSVQFIGDTTAGTVTWKYNATESDIVAAFERHTDVAEGGVVVKKNGPGDITIELVGAGIKESNTPTLTISSNSLKVPPGVTAPMPGNSSLISSYLGTAASVPVTLEVEITRVSGQPWTVLELSDVTLSRDLLRNTPSQNTGGQSFVMSGEIPAGACWLRRLDGTVVAFYQTADTNAARGLALTSALATAVAGELIEVGPGTFDARNLFKNGVNWHFHAGAILDYTGTFDGSVFSDAADGTNSAVTCKITGHGVFKRTGAAATGAVEHAVFRISNASSSIHIDGLEIYNEDSDNSNACILVTNGTVVANVPTLTSDGYDAILIGGGTARIVSRAVSGGDDGVEQSGGTLFLECDSIIGGSGDPINKVDGTATIRARTITGNVTLEGTATTILDAVITGNLNQVSGTTRLIGVKVDNQADASNDAITMGGGVLILDHAIIIAHGSQDSIGAGSAKNVIAYASYANRATDGNITITITGGLTVDADVV